MEIVTYERDQREGEPKPPSSSETSALYSHLLPPPTLLVPPLVRSTLWPAYECNMAWRELRRINVEKKEVVHRKQLRSIIMMGEMVLA